MRQDREEKQARRAEVEARISANLRMATAAEAARKSAFYSKKEAHEAHRAAMAEERQRERDAAAAAALAAEQKRAAILQPVQINTSTAATGATDGVAVDSSAGTGATATFSYYSICSVSVCKQSIPGSLRQTRAEEQRRRDMGLAEFEAQELYLKQLQVIELHPVCESLDTSAAMSQTPDERDRERRIQRERNDLQNQLKQENVDRMARIQ
eukprot:1691-Heterococcus_DN1.PRE.2